MTASPWMTQTRNHRIVIVGGGFGGLHAARALRKADADVILIDRKNYHLFQPLLYQVATGGLNPGDIAAPLRTLVRRQRNTTVLLGEVTGIDPDNRRVKLEDAEVAYDSLILAAGATGHHYFGNPEWGKHAPGLKTIEDATDVRSRVLLAFEAAERETDPATRRELLTFTIVGGGPTGVELAGAIAELARNTLPGEFRNIDPQDSRVILIEGMEHVLPPFPDRLAIKAERALRRRGVELHLGCMVSEIDEDGVVYQRDDESHRLPSRTVLWAGGVQASPLGNAIADGLNIETDKGGRVPVTQHLSVAHHPNVHVIGDLAATPGPDGEPLPGLAAVAMQQGRYVGRSLRRQLDGKPVKPFRYRDKGIMATVGKRAAIADFGRLQLWGWPGWITWLGVHLLLLAQTGNKLFVFLHWAYNYVTNGRHARMITWKRPTAFKRPAEQEGDRRLVA